MKLKMPDKLLEKNLSRAMRAETILMEYQTAIGGGEKPDLSTVIDLVCDLCHLLHLDEKTAGCMTAVDIQEALASGYNHFYCEGVEPDDITLATLEE